MGFRRVAAALLSAALLLPALSGCRGQAEPAQRTVLAMDTAMELTVYSASARQNQAALDAAAEKLAALDAALAVTDGDSEIAALNRAGGAPTPLSGDTSALLERALDLCGTTGGALDLTAYPAVRAWGFTTGEYRVPEQAELDALAERIDYAAVAETPEGWTLPAGMELDLGAVAKGWAADELEELLGGAGIGQALINLGQSTILALGERPGGGPWRIGVQDPAGEGYLAVVGLSGHMSTSGGYQRFFERDGQTYWHIIDPDTAAPARSGLGSVTVLGESGLVCDGLSTALFVMGLERGARFLRDHPELGVEAVFITEDGAISITPGLEGSFALAQGYEDREVTVLP